MEAGIVDHVWSLEEVIVYWIEHAAWYTLLPMEPFHKFIYSQQA